MRTFKIGDVVRVVSGFRAGEIAVVESELMRLSRICHPLAHAAGSCWCGEPYDSVHYLSLPSVVIPGAKIGAPPSHLEPYWEGKEASDQTLAEILDGVRGVKVNEGAE